jgi:hypothetical protein
VTSKPIHDLATYHRNPRRGDVSRLCESLIVHGQYRPIVINKGTLTGRKNEVLAGNHLLMAFRELAESSPDDERWAHLAEARRYEPGEEYWTEIAVHEVDVDDDQAARIVAVDNRTAELGGYDDAQLLELLRSLPDLDGTGYTELDLEALDDIVSGAPTLDELADEFGEPGADDTANNLSLRKIDPHTRRLWDAHRKNFATDNDALLRLLDDEVAA